MFAANYNYKLIFAREVSIFKMLNAIFHDYVEVFATDKNCDFSHTQSLHSS